MTAILLTGMSGAGKSTVLAELARRGHRVVDTDHGGCAAETPDGQMWVEERITSLSCSVMVCAALSKGPL